MSFFFLFLLCVASYTSSLTHLGPKAKLLPGTQVQQQPASLQTNYRAMKTWKRYHRVPIMCSGDQVQNIVIKADSIGKCVEGAAEAENDADRTSVHGRNSDACPLKVVIAGAPASGKGTQCEYIKEAFGVVHLSTGDMLREAVQDGTALGKQAKKFMDAGKLVPDELVIGIVIDRLQQVDCQQKGWLLDGFPRTKAQADALRTAGMIPDCFVMLDVPEDILVQRVTGRRTDPVTGKIYHMTFSPPDSEEVAQRLFQRSDDTAEKVKVRFRDFQANIDAIKGSYKDKMIWVDGTQSAEDVAFCVVDSISKCTESAAEDEKEKANHENHTNVGVHAPADSGAAGARFSSSVSTTRLSAHMWIPPVPVASRPTLRASHIFRCAS